MKGAGHVGIGLTFAPVPFGGVCWCRMVRESVVWGCRRPPVVIASYFHHRLSRLFWAGLYFRRRNVSVCKVGRRWLDGLRGLVVRVDVEHDVQVTPSM